MSRSRINLILELEDQFSQRQITYEQYEYELRRFDNSHQGKLPRHAVRYNELDDIAKALMEEFRQ